jgi:hypothetical protein
MTEELSAEESRRRAAAVTDLLEQIQTGNPTDWWNLTTYRELGDRTPTRAWLDGDHEAVEALIASWYEASERAAERHRNDPEFMAMLRQRRADISRPLSA